MCERVKEGVNVCVLFVYLFCFYFCLKQTTVDVLESRLVCRAFHCDYKCRTKAPCTTSAVASLYQCLSVLRPPHQSLCEHVCVRGSLVVGTCRHRDVHDLRDLDVPGAVRSDTGQLGHGWVGREVVSIRNTWWEMFTHRLQVQRECFCSYTILQEGSYIEVVLLTQAYPFISVNYSGKYESLTERKKKYVCVKFLFIFLSVHPH